MGFTTRFLKGMVKTVWIKGLKIIAELMIIMSLFFFKYRIYWCVLDGADCNRQFIKIHFKDKDPADSKFVTTNIYTGCPMIFIMDPKVVYH